MQRHGTDFVALLFGLLFLALGGGYVAHEATNRSLDPVWVVAVTCSTVGAAFLAVTLVPRRDRGEPAPEVELTDDEPGRTQS